MLVDKQKFQISKYWLNKGIWLWVIIENQNMVLTKVNSIYINLWHKTLSTIPKFHMCHCQLYILVMGLTKRTLIDVKGLVYVVHPILNIISYVWLLWSVIKNRSIWTVIQCLFFCNLRLDKNRNICHGLVVHIIRNRPNYY